MPAHGPCAPQERGGPQLLKHVEGVGAPDRTVRKETSARSSTQNAAQSDHHHRPELRIHHAANHAFQSGAAISSTSQDSGSIPFPASDARMPSR